MQLGSQQWEPFLDLLELLPPDLALPTPAAQHFAPITLHGTMHLPQCPNVSGNAVVSIVTAKHLIEVVCLLLKRRVPHPSHLVRKRISARRRRDFSVRNPTRKLPFRLRVQYSVKPRK